MKGGFSWEKGQAKKEAGCRKSEPLQPFCALCGLWVKTGAGA